MPSGACRLHVPRHGLLACATPSAVLRGENVIDRPEAERVLETERLLGAAALARAAAGRRFPGALRGTDEAVLAHGFGLGYRAPLTQRERVLRFVEE